MELGSQTSLFLFCGIKRITKLNWVEEKIDLQKKKRFSNFQKWGNFFSKKKKEKLQIE